MGDVGKSGLVMKMASGVFLMFAAAFLLSSSAWGESDGKARVERAREMDVYRIESATPGASIAIWHESGVGSSAAVAKNSQVVLFIHGATVSGGMSVGYRINGYSWMDDVAQSGRDVWALDFVGYGKSDIYQQMKTSERSTPLGEAEELVPDIERAVDYIVKKTGVSKITLIATSRGAIPTGYYVTQHPEKVERVVFNSPIVRRDNTPEEVIKGIFGFAGRPTLPYYDISTAQRLSMLADDRPKNTALQLEPYFVAHWPSDFSKESLSESKESNAAASVRVPGGFAVDIYDAWHGKYWNPEKVTVPVLIVRGDYDRVLTPASDAQWLYDKLIAAPSKRYVLIDKGTHAMLFEKKRFELYREVQLFLDAKYDQIMQSCTNCGGRG